MNRTIGAVLGVLALGAPALAQEADTATPYRTAFENARAYLQEDADGGQAEAADAVALYILGNIANTMFHEFGHALKSELEIPILGKEEDAVDTFANVIMVAKETDPVLDAMILAVADDYFAAGQFSEESGDEPTPWDEHSPDQARAYNVICILVGADPEGYKDAADNAGMPPERQESCSVDYEDAVNAWDKLLEPHYLAEGEAQKSKVEIVYADPPAGLETIAGFIKASGMVEVVADEVTAMVRLPNDITIGVESCGEVNAYWSPDERKLTFCYEIAQSYFDNAMAATE